MHLLSLEIVRNNIRQFVLIAAAAITACINTSVLNAGDSKNVSLYIEAIKNEVTSEQPFQIRIIFSTSEKHVRLYRHQIFGMSPAVGEGDWLDLDIISPSGEALVDYGSHEPDPKRPYKRDYVEVTPNRPFIETLRIYPSKFHKNVGWPQKGIYKIMAKYEYIYNPQWKYGDDLWEGKVVSNEIEIVVN